VETGVMIYTGIAMAVSFLTLLYLTHKLTGLIIDVETSAREEQKYLTELLNAERPGYGLYKRYETEQVKAAAQLPDVQSTTNNPSVNPNLPEYVPLGVQDIIE